MSTSEYEDDENYKPLCEVSNNQRKFYVLDLAEKLYVYSTSNDGGLPKVSPEEAFASAESFAAEAMRRGY